MRFELYIEKKRLDVNEGFSSLLTFAIDDIKDFAARNTTFSKTIILPGTANNNYLFGNIFDVRISNPFNASGDNVATNFNPAVSADCVIFQDNIQVFKGTLRLLEVVIDNVVPEYEVAVFGELGGLVGSIGANKLTDLDFSAYDTTWDASGVTSSWTASPGSGVHYPLIDYGGVSSNKVDYDIRACRPALFVREYIDKIITDAGYTWECDLFDTDRFKRLVVPNNQKTFQNKTDLIFYVYRTSPYMMFDSDGGTPALPQSLKFNLLDVLGSFTSNVDQNEFTYTGADTVIGKFNIEISLEWQGQLKELNVTLQKNGTDVYTFPTIGSSSSPINTTLSVTDQEITINNGDVFRLYFTVTNLGGLSRYYIYIEDAIWQIQTAVPVWTNINEGDLIEINDSIPQNILQRDFLSSVVKLFNLYIHEDKFTSKKLLITPYVDYYDLNPSGVVDWTYKLDRSKPIRIRPMSELNSRYYNFDYKDDSDYYNELYRKTYNENYGRRLYDSEFEFANDKTDITLIFSPSVLVGYTGVDKLVTALYKKNNGIEETYATNIRILQTMNVTGVTSWSLKDGGITLQSGLTNYGYAGHYNDPDAPANDIHFGVPAELYFTLSSGAVNVTQFNVYWSPYMAEITDKDSKLMTAYFKLTAKDIFDLDFSKLIYLDGSYWRLNKIEDWNASEPDVCKCELLKVINLLY